MKNFYSFVTGILIAILLLAAQACDIVDPGKDCQTLKQSNIAIDACKKWCKDQGCDWLSWNSFQNTCYCE